MILGDRSAPLPTFAGRIAQAGEALASGPFVHVVEELAALLGSTKRRNGANHAAFVDDARKQPEARAFEMLADVGDQERIAQVRLVGTVLEQRFLVRDA